MSLNSKLLSSCTCKETQTSSPNKETLQQEIFPAQMVVKSYMIHLKIVHNKTVPSKYFIYHKFEVWTNESP